MNKEALLHRPKRFLQNVNYKEVAKDVAIYSPVALTGGVLGAAAANKFSPSTVVLSDKIEAQVALDVGEPGLTIDYGSTIHLPNAIDSFLSTTHTGVNIDINTINASTQDPEALKEFSSLAAQYKPNIIEPIQDALFENLMAGARIGAVALMASCALSVSTYRHIREKGGLSYIRERARQSRMRTKILAGLCGAAALFSMGSAVKGNIQGPNSVQQNIVKNHLPKQITDTSPLLKDAWIEGLGSEFPEKLVKAFIAYKNDVDESLAISKRNFHQQFAEYRDDKSSLINNPTLRPVMHISDPHCNYAIYKNILTPVTAAFRPQLILNTGDTFTNGGTMPYEDNCYTSFREAIAKGNKNTTIVNTIGNHDPKDYINIDSDPKVITPTKDDNYTVTTEIGDIVVTPDESLSTWESKPEEKSPEMYKLNAEQGRLTAEKACDIQDKTGEEPKVMVHRPQASFETSMRGCASLILKGHTHDNQPIKKVQSEDGETVLHHTAGSSSGTHNGIAIYETPKRPASYSILYFDKTNTLQGATTVTFTSDGRVSIADEGLPKKTDQDLDLAQNIFAKEHIKSPSS